ncbi:hypothetical protein MKO06_11925 [Gramella sp. GC03-9]|uniref:Uncharacterized protein n=1 Tax=Christiangramia oceanisediminis TaxID=2920386 RepID=A0A9X2RDF2_9FLAO|nr:hypothetical protein [Gramella oceanisediminis]MCP9200621.1 hypothetical protein [Gramella oceanisediminis]
MIYAAGKDLEILSKHFLKLKKDNFEFQDCSFAGVNSSAVGSFCKYGDIHYLIYEENEKQEIDKIISKTGLSNIPFGACTYKF